MNNRQKWIFKFIIIGVAAIFIVAGCVGKNGTNGASGVVMPVIQSMAVQGLPAQPDSSVTAMVSAQSSDGLALTYTWTVSAGWTVSNEGNTPTATITAPNTYGTAGTATVTITDAHARTAVGTAALITLTKSLAGANPLISEYYLNSGKLPAIPGANLVIAILAKSPQGLALTYTWTSTSGWTILQGGNTSVVTIVAPDAYGATGTATITVTDTQGGSVTWKIALSTMTAAPVIQSVNATGVPAPPGANVITTVNAYSPMGLGLTFTWTVSSGWTIANGGNSAVATIIAPATYGATGTATIMVSDTNGMSTVDTVSLSTLSGVPIINGITVYYQPGIPAIQGDLVLTGTIFTAVVSAYSPKGLGPNYSWTASGGWTITSGTHSSVVYVTSPDTYSTPGVLSVNVTDTQGGLAICQADVQTVSPPPLPAIQSLTAWGLPVSPGASVIANVMVQSSQGLTITYSWTVSNGWTISTGGNTSVVTITAPGTYGATGTASVTVTDSLGRVVSGSIPLSTISTIPVINNISAWGMPITPSTSFTATVSATSHVGYTLYYTWTTSTNWTITTGGSSNQVTITSPGAYSMTGTASVIVYDLNGGSAIATIPLATAPQTENYFATGIYSQGIAIDVLGHIWIANNGSANVSVLNSSGAALFTPTVGSSPVGIAIDASGNAWVTNSGSGTVTELSSSGITLGTYPVYTAGASPKGIAIDHNGNVWIANENSNSVTELNSSGYPIGTYSLVGPSYCGYNGYSIAIDASGNAWVTTGCGNIVELSPAGNIEGTYTPPNQDYINIVGGIAIDGSGNVWVVYNIWNGSDEVNVLTKLSSTGSVLGTYTFGSKAWGVGGIAIDASGNVWVAWIYETEPEVTELSPSTGQVISQYGATSYSTYQEYDGIAIDASGNVWVTIQRQSFWSSSVAEFLGAAAGPQFFPYAGPQWP